MKYKVYKNLRKQALIIGLKLRVFYIFLIPSVLGLFSLVNGMTMFKVVVVSSFITVLYMVLRFLQNFDFEQFNDVLPSKLRN